MLSSHRRTILRPSSILSSSVRGNDDDDNDGDIEGYAKVLLYATQSDKAMHITESEQASHGK